MRAPTCSLYFAYGSNLCIRQMQRRCPAATPLHKFKLEDSRLTFRGVADCPRVVGSVCYGGLWRITAECEDSLDRYEGVHGGFYRKDYIPLDPTEHDGETHLMLYVMNSTGIFPPAHSYLETIAQGYRDFRLPMDSLKAAVAHSHDHRSPSGTELRRHTRLGKPRLAPRPLLPGETERPAWKGYDRNLTREHWGMDDDAMAREDMRRDVREELDRAGFQPPKRKYPFGEPKRHNLDEWLELRRRDRNYRQAQAMKRRQRESGGNFDLFDEWWHSPLTDND